MSAQIISQASFAMETLNEKAYQVAIQFENGIGTPSFKKTIVFTEDHPVEIGETVDIYSQNGTASNPMQNLFVNKSTALFTKNDVKGMQKAYEKKETSKLQGSTVLVLDMKDQNKSYLDGPSIEEAEKTVCQFYGQKKAESDFLPEAKKILAIMQEGLPCDFVVREGALKNKIIQDFPEKEAEWLLQSKEGAIAFCQWAEFHIYGFKMGQCPKNLNFSDYFYPVSDESSVFKPHTKSIVWYPEAYKKIYSLNGKFANTLKQIFSVAGEEYCTKSKITSWNVGKKQ